MDSLLHRVKAMIWVQSLIGAGLVLAFFATLEKQVEQSTFILGIGLVWCVALRPIARWAEDLTRDERARATGLPGWVLVLLAIGQLASLAAPSIPHLGWLIVGHLFVGGTLICRGFLSVALDVPIHGRTWAACMSLMAFGLVRHLAVAFLEAVAGC
jgi:hypothetical protein